MPETKYEVYACEGSTAYLLAWGAQSHKSGASCAIPESAPLRWGFPLSGDRGGGILFIHEGKLISKGPTGTRVLATGLTSGEVEGIISFFTTAVNWHGATASLRASHRESAVGPNQIALDANQFGRFVRFDFLLLGRGSDADVANFLEGNRPGGPYGFYLLSTSPPMALLHRQSGILVPTESGWVRAEIAPTPQVQVSSTSRGRSRTSWFVLARALIAVVSSDARVLHEACAAAAPRAGIMRTRSPSGLESALGRPARSLRADDRNQRAASDRER